MKQGCKLFFKPGVICTALVVVSLTFVSAQNYADLRFTKNGTFKIAQFTDLHWDNNSPNCDKTIATIKSVLNEEKPDLVILTGDIITEVPAREGWLAMSDVFIEAKIPWAVTLGNHDAEPGISRDEIFELLDELPYFIGTKGPDLYGCGNYFLCIKKHNGKEIGAVIYCFDSNDYANDKNNGGYDWIRYDQIGWYRKTSDSLSALNNHLPYPSLAYFHIPLQEYNAVVGQETMLGNKNEGIASAGVNSGLFASMVEKNDIMGVFTGHDHDNDYIGITHDIALAYGRVTGADAYGNLERGARTVELHQGEFSFDTWIRTPSGMSFQYNYPSGMAYDSDVVYWPSLKVKNPVPGLRYTYYEGHFQSVDELATSTGIKSGITRNLSLELAEAKDSFAFEFNGWIKIPQKAQYRFYTSSDDGTKLFIDGKEVINNDGSHGVKRKNVLLALDKGFHSFKLLYFEDYGGQKLELGFSSIAIRECIIPDVFFYTHGYECMKKP